ncbi:MAG: IclR family transcriptional regulator [Thermodesulfobacteriota bacterium]
MMALFASFGAFKVMSVISTDHGRNKYFMVKDQKKSIREESRHVNTVLRVLEIFECFKLKQLELSLTELSGMTGMQKSRLLRLCGTLVFKGYLSRDQNSRKYSLGPRLMVLGRIYESANTLSNIAQPIIKELAGQTNETVSLFIVLGAKRLCLAKEDGDHPIRFVNVAGDILDLHRGVGGKVLLAYMAEAERKKILGTILADPETSLEASNIAAFRAELREIRAKGHVQGFGDVIEGVAAIAAPVFDHSGACRASIAVVGPIQRFTPDRCSVLLRRLLEATARLSSQLGFDPEGARPPE